MDVTKNVAVMMPFGGSEEGDTRERECILEFQRLRYIIEQKINVKPAGAEQGRIKYEVQAFKANVGHIPRDGLRTIADADVLVGLLTEKNVNVVYELAVRNLLRDEMLLLVKNQPPDLVPVYMKEMANIPYEKHDNERVTKKIDAIAHDEEKYPILNMEDDVPSELKQVIDEHNEKLRGVLERNLQKLEANPPKRPDFILDLVKDLDPGLILSTWDSFYPYSVVRIKWHGQSEADYYKNEDMDGVPVVYYANDLFLRLCNFQRNELPDPDSASPLTSDDIVKRLRRREVVDEEDLEAFIKDQTNLMTEIAFNNAYASATTTLRFNKKHKIYPNQAFLPVLAGKRTVGLDRKQPHTTYVLVIYVEVQAIGQEIDAQIRITPGRQPQVYRKATGS